jgi:hypothetical protein
MTRLEELRDFAKTWLCRSLTEHDGVEAPTSAVMPQALRDIYLAFGGVEALTTAHNRLYPPQGIVISDGYGIFYDENQSVVRWAFRDCDAAADDPIVYQGTVTEDGHEWYSEEMPLSAWIKVMCFWQLVNAGYPHSAYSDGIAGATATVETSLPHLTTHADGSTRYYGVPGQLICLAGPASIPSVWAGAVSPEAFTSLSQTLDFDWDYCTDDDD